MPEQAELKENTHLMNKYFPFNLFRNSSDSGNILHTHWHEHIEIIYLVEGSAVFHIGTEAYPLEKGEIAFVNKGLLHSGYSIQNTRVDYYAIVFHPSLLASQSPDPVHSRLIAPFASGQAVFPGRLDRQSSGYTAICGLIQGIVAEFENKEPGCEIAIKANLQLLALQILRNFPEALQDDSGHRTAEKNMDKFKNLITYVEEHYAEKITIGQASGLVNMSPFHFCKTFKTITGRTFIEFLNLYRVNRAEEFLRSTGCTISEVAEKVGFCNINYFDRLFKQYKQYSPSKSRK